MCEMTSMGLMSAARTTTPMGDEEVVAVDLRSALTTSLTPRLRVRFAAAGQRPSDQPSTHNSDKLNVKLRSRRVCARSYEWSVYAYLSSHS